MYSIYDKEIRKYLESGKNSDSLSTCIDALTSLLEPDLEPEVLSLPDNEKQEIYENMGFEFEYHNQKIKLS